MSVSFSQILMTDIYDKLPEEIFQSANPFIMIRCQYKFITGQPAKTAFIQIGHSQSLVLV